MEGQTKREHNFLDLSAGPHGCIYVAHIAEGHDADVVQLLSITNEGTKTARGDDIVFEFLDVHAPPLYT